jgi:uncharacterized protein
MKHLTLFGFISLICYLSSSPVSANEVEWGTKLTMRDGVRLNATIYRPDEQVKALPVIVTMTPYISDSYHEFAAYFADHGYIFAIVDVRGRGSSEGDFKPFVNEANDGYDVVEALAKIRLGDGQVGMWGGSYAGTNQWQTAAKRPPSLKTIVPVASAYPGHDFPMRRNIRDSYTIQWGTFTSGRTGNSNLFDDEAYWLGIYDKQFQRGAPFSQLDRAAGNVTTEFQTWLKHPEPDAFWDSMNPSTPEYAALTIPILTITGHYDDDQYGAMQHYRYHFAANPKQASLNHYLLIGPWDHAGTRRPKSEYGGLALGDKSMADLKALHVAWYDWVMKGGRRPAFLADKVTWFTVGTNRWSSAPTLSNTSERRTTYYLSSPQTNPNSAFRSGDLALTKSKNGDFDSFTSDPSVLDRANYELEPREDFLLDQRDVMAIDDDGLVYQTPPLRTAMVVTGQPSVKLRLMIDTPDVDLAVRLYEIRPDGVSIKLSDDLMRARYRKSPRIQTPVIAGRYDDYIFDQFAWFSRKIGAGSRLRLVVTGINNRRQEKNFNAGGVVAEESMKDARISHIRVDTTSSILTLPLPLQVQ